MKKGIIVENKWAGNPCYFINMNYPVRTGKMEAKKIGGYFLWYVQNKWTLERADIYIQSLKDKEMFSEVGYIDLEKVCIDAILKELNLQNTEREKYDNN